MRAAAFQGSVLGLAACWDTVDSKVRDSRGKPMLFWRPFLYY